MTKLQWFYAICLYFITFAFLGVILNEIVVITMWSISIFFVIYITYWLVQLVIGITQSISIQLEILKEELENKNNEYNKE